MSESTLPNPQLETPKVGLVNVANAYTFSRFALTPVWVWLFALGVDGDSLLLIVSLLVGALVMISDALDGYYARKHKTTSNFGKLFDPLADAFFFVTLFVTFGVLGVVPIWLVLPFVARELLQHLYVRPMALRLGITMGAKMIGKIKTGVQCFAGLVVIAVEIVRSFDRELTVHFDLHALFTTLDWIAWISVGAAATLSIVSILPYLKHLAKAQAEASRENRA